jgi:hypothetical protein
MLVVYPGGTEIEDTLDVYDLQKQLPEMVKSRLSVCNRSPMVKASMISLRVTESPNNVCCFQIKSKGM